VGDVENCLKLANKRLVANDGFSELLVYLGLGVLMDRQVQGQFRAKIVVQGPRRNADGGRNVTVGGDFVPMDREHLAGDDQNAFSGLD